ncbi:MAG: aminodeoxychorismate/anthranilate synthase component II [Bacteroidales bacterium]|nr:aminodeoxychorismate/anthranilate synthase component II [Bacteroidales bacterium]
MKILLVDNHDSFVFNIVELLQQCRAEFPDLEWNVVKNDCITADAAAAYDAVILSPGPGIPAEAGRMMEVIRACAACIPMLGICLGCQAIAEAFGGRLRQLEAPRHGHGAVLCVDDASDPIVGFLAGAGSRVGRYHSWVIDEASLADSVPLRVSARDDEGNIMSVSHKWLPVFGVQFHPESIITEHGLRMLANFLHMAAGRRG